MPAGTGTLGLAQVINFLSLPQLGISAGIPVSFPTGSAQSNAIQLTAGSGAAKYNVAYASTATYGTGAGTNQVNSLVTVDSTGSGNFKLTVEGITTGNIAYSATPATIVSNSNTAMNTTFGASAIVMSGASLAALILTFSGTGYTHRPVGATTATLQSGATGFTMNGSGTVNVPSTCPVTTPGVQASGALNLTNTLTQPDGTLATFADVLVLCLYAPSTNTDYINVGAGTDPLAWLTNAIPIYPGMTLNMLYPVVAGLAVTTTSADRINIVANSATQSLTVLLAGH